MNLSVLVQSPTAKPVADGLIVTGQISASKHPLPRRRGRRNVFGHEQGLSTTSSSHSSQIHDKAVTSLSSRTSHTGPALVDGEPVMTAAAPAENLPTTELDSGGQDVWISHLTSDGPSPPPSFVQPTTIIGNQRRPPVSLRITIGSTAPPQPKLNHAVPRSLPRLRQPTVFVDEEAAKKEIPQPPILLSSTIVASPEADDSLVPVTLPGSRPAQQWAPLGNVRTSLPRRRTKDAIPTLSHHSLPIASTPVEPAAEEPHPVQAEVNLPPPAESPKRKPRSLGLPKLKQNSVRSRFLQDEERSEAKFSGEGSPAFIRRPSYSHNAH